MKNSKQVFMIYRDNTLFQKQMPIFLAKLQANDFTVENHVFPMGTLGNEIFEWLKSNIQILQGKKVISDNTVNRYMYNFKIQDVIDLDQLSQNVSVDSIYDDLKALYPEKRKLLGTEGVTFDESAKLYSTVLKKIISDPTNRPTKVYISLSKITSHGAFVQIYRMSPEEQIRIFREIIGNDYILPSGEKISQIETLTKVILTELFDIVWKQEKSKFGEWAGEQFKSWFIQGGIDSGILEFLEADASLDASKGKGNWFVVDRHIDLSDEDRKSFNDSGTKVLELPFSSFLKDAMNYGLISISEERIENAWNEIAKNLNDLKM